MKLTNLPEGYSQGQLVVATSRDLKIKRLAFAYARIKHPKQIFTVRMNTIGWSGDVHAMPRKLYETLVGSGMAFWTE